ncbi:MAG: hypothetical protein WCI47_02760 [bacterium]
MNAPIDDSRDDSAQYADTPPGEPRVFFSSFELEGRFFGQSDLDADLVIGIAEISDGVYALVITTPDDDHWRQNLEHGGVLIQLFEQPDVPWFAEVTVFNGLPMIKYIPMHLESFDGTHMVRLQPVAPEKVARALATRRRNLIGNSPQ